MNGAMARATLAGAKSQTRRVVKQLDPREGAVTKDSNGQSMAACWAYGGPVIDCPYGVPGQRLWVRETFFAYGRWVTRYSEKKKRDEWHFIDMTVECDRAYQYDADAPDLPLAKGRGGALPGWRRRPAIFMPRAASRILLEIVSVRVERLNDISDADIIAEGIPLDTMRVNHNCKGDGFNSHLRADWRRLWEAINGAGSWAANPWVWVVEFKRVTL
jgi:hypothetical protein